VNDCATCLYRETCDDTCLGYVPDDETAAARADYEERCADIDSDESEDRNGCVQLFDVAVAQLEREGW